MGSRQDEQDDWRCIYPDGMESPAQGHEAARSVHLPRRGCTTQPRVAYSRTLGERPSPTSTYPEGVAQHSPGSRYAAHPGETTAPNVYLPRRGCTTQDRGTQTARRSADVSMMDHRAINPTHNAHRSPRHIC